MTLGEYLEGNLAGILSELCQYQKCDNCSVRALFSEGRCPLWDMPAEDALDFPVEPY